MGNLIKHSEVSTSKSIEKVCQYDILLNEM